MFELESNLLRDQDASSQVPSKKKGLFKPDNVALEQPAKEAVLLINPIFERLGN